VHKGDASKAVRQGSHEVHIGKIAFHADLFFSFAVEQKHAWRPYRIKAMEPGRMFLDMRLHRNEILVNEAGSLLVFVRLGIQPSTSSLSRRGAKIQQDRPLLLFCHSQRLINIFAPIDTHVFLQQELNLLLQS